MGKESLAISYALKKKSKKKMADGGPVSQPSPSPDPYQAAGQSLQADPKKNPAAKAVMAAFAEGGQIQESDGDELKMVQGSSKGPTMDHRSGYMDHDSGAPVPCAHCGAEDARGLGQHGAIEEGPQGGGQGFHGESYKGNPGNSWDNYSESEDGDGMGMVGRVMAQKQQSFAKGGIAEDMISRLMKRKKMSEGGKVANQDTQITGMMPNEFDDLHLRDDLEENYTGSNSGDEIGDAQEDQDRKDIISRIMKSRAKKDKNPRPA